MLALHGCNDASPQRCWTATAVASNTTSARRVCPVHGTQVYRNNTRLGLTGALEAVYPVVSKLVGGVLPLRRRQYIAVIRPAWATCMNTAVSQPFCARSNRPPSWCICLMSPGWNGVTTGFSPPATRRWTQSAGERANRTTRNCAFSCTRRAPAGIAFSILPGSGRATRKTPSETSPMDFIRGWRQAAGVPARDPGHRISAPAGLGIQPAARLRRRL